MATATASTTRDPVRRAPSQRGRSRIRGATRTRERPNRVGMFFALLWLAVILVPLYMMVSWSLQRQDTFEGNGPLSPPDGVTAQNVRNVFERGFVDLLVNTAVVTSVCVGLTLVLSVPAAYAIVRSPSWLVSLTFRLFLLGLAIPAQATIIPIYLMIVRMGLYDTLMAIILPTVAFGLPLSVLILASALRDVPADQYEAMTLDGAGAFRIMIRLVIPLSRGGIATVGIFSALNAWNGFLFPLILTQSEDRRVLTLGLFSFQTEFGTDFPGLMTAVLLSAAPIFVAYLLARRWLVAGLAGVGGR